MTNYKCPKCGNTENFRAQTISVLLHGVPFDSKGFSYLDYDYSESEILPNHNLTCQDCGYEATGHEFLNEHPELTRYIKLKEHFNAVCKYCESDECPKCIITNLIDNAAMEAESKGILEDYSEFYCL